MAKLNKSKVLKSVALVGGVAAVGAVSTNVAHADADAPQVATTQSASNQQSTDAQIDQLNNQLQNQKASQASSDQAAIATETTKVNKTASDATAKENASYSDAVTKQKAANAKTLADAQAHITTPAQQQEQRQAAQKQFAKDQQKLNDSHQANLKQLKSKYDTQTAKINDQIKSHQTAAQKEQSQKVANATAKIDGEINDTQTNVNNLQEKVNQDQVDVTNAQSDVKKEQGKLTAAQDALKDAQKLADLKQQQATAQDALKKAQTELAAAQAAHKDSIKQLSALQDKVKEAQQQADLADQAYSTAQQNLQKAQATLQSQQAQLKALQERNVITVPAGYIDTWKEYLSQKKSTDYVLSKNDYPELWNKMSKLDKEAQELNVYHDNEAAKQVKVVLNANGTLSRDDIIKATQFAAQLINPLRKQLGIVPFSITNASIDIAQDVENGYRNDKWNMWTSAGHDTALLGKIANNWGVDNVSESWAGDISFSKPEWQQDDGLFVHYYDNLTLNDLYRGVYDALVSLLFEDAEQDYGHTTDILGLRTPNTERLGVGFDYGKGDKGWGQVNVGGFHFDSIADKTSQQLQNMANQGYIWKGIDPNSKANLPENIKEIAIPTDNIAQQISALQSQIAKSQTAVQNAQAKDNQAKSDNDQAKASLKTAQNNLNKAKADAQNSTLVKDQKAVDAAQQKVDQLTKQVEDLQSKVDTKTDTKQVLSDAQKALKQAQNKLDSAKQTYQKDTDALKAAQNKLTSLKATRDNDIKNLAGVSTGVDSPEVTKLKNQLKNVNDGYTAEVNKENADYQAKFKAAKEAYDSQIHDIDAKPTSVAELRKQLDAKLDQLKADHEAKLAKIKSDAQAQINAYKQQLQAQHAKENQPILDKIAQIKAEEAATTAQNSHSNATTSVITGNSNSYSSKNGITVLLPSESGTMDNHVKVAPASEENAQQGKLPQTGSQSALAAIILGAASAMFGFGLAAKKQY